MRVLAKQGETRGNFVGSRAGNEIWERAILGNWELWKRSGSGCGWGKARKALEPSGQGRIRRNVGDNVWRRSGKVVWKEPDQLWGPWRAAVNKHSDQWAICTYIQCVYTGHLLCIRPWAVQNMTRNNRRCWLWQIEPWERRLLMWVLTVVVLQRTHLSYHSNHVRVCLASFTHPPIKPTSLLPWGYAVLRPPRP